MPIKYVPKACAYITRVDTGELLVFDGPDHRHWQIPKGTIESGETPIEAVRREVFEETGLTNIDVLGRIQTDVWDRRPEEKRYVRYFFHAKTTDQREEWVHTVSGDTDERGKEFRCRWVSDPAVRSFALDLDDYLHEIDALQPPVPRARRSKLQ
jgi:8-oxo-dGTP pyrophosphatase MutT (NUDIX family)